MTPPGGSRDDDDGAPGDDPKLRAMRAVWLEMRDEDPPDRGLTDLLAAARSKAAAMQPPPSAWQRLLAALRRPPVLALATVTVLIAGAVLIGRRISPEAAPGPTAAQDAAGPARRVEVDHGAGSSSGALGSRPEATGAQSTEHATAAPGRAPAVAAPQPAAPPPAAPALPPDHDVRPEPPAHVAPSPAPSKPPATDTPGEALREEGDDRAAAGAPPAAPPAPADPGPATAAPATNKVTQLGASAAVPGADTGGDNARNAARPPRKVQPPAGASNDGRNDTARSAANRTPNNAANNTANPVANGVAEPSRRPSPAPTRPDAPGDLSRQCEAAALRGDCAAVRQLVDRISRTDRGFRARVAKDSPVGKCLAE